eukprot:TRINITY_DN4468_c0_g1_i3.p1 TRINITY_DN4468_c0_g1~~TRINITY_DN4468_c0_g1_i3.p1  ORF type:complete len:607 (+),score=97.78 TRINITY_DN4468_c0_g1_i3:54-1874(+)
MSDSFTLSQWLSPDASVLISSITPADADTLCCDKYIVRLSKADEEKDFLVESPLSDGISSDDIRVGQLIKVTEIDWDEEYPKIVSLILSNQSKVEPTEEDRCEPLVISRHAAYTKAPLLAKSRWSAPVNPYHSDVTSFHEKASVDDDCESVAESMTSQTTNQSTPIQAARQSVADVMGFTPSSTVRPLRSTPRPNRSSHFSPSAMDESSVTPIPSNPRVRCSESEAVRVSLFAPANTPTSRNSRDTPKSSNSRQRSSSTGPRVKTKSSLESLYDQKTTPKTKPNAIEEFDATMLEALPMKTIKDATPVVKPFLGVASELSSSVRIESPVVAAKVWQLSHDQEDDEKDLSAIRHSSINRQQDLQAKMNLMQMEMQQHSFLNQFLNDFTALKSSTTQSSYPHLLSLLRFHESLCRYMSDPQSPVMDDYEDGFQNESRAPIREPHDIISHFQSQLNIARDSDIPRTYVAAIPYTSNTIEPFITGSTPILRAVESLDVQPNGFEKKAPTLQQSLTIHVLPHFQSLRAKVEIHSLRTAQILLGKSADFVNSFLAQSDRRLEKFQEMQHKLSRFLARVQNHNSLPPDVFQQQSISLASKVQRVFQVLQASTT